MELLLLINAISCITPYKCNIMFYYIPITDMTIELSVFWPSDRESWINELRFSESISLSYKMRLTLVTAFEATLRKVNCKHGTRDGKHVDVTSRNVNSNGKRSRNFSGLKTKTGFKIRKNV